MADPKKDADDICPASKFARAQQKTMVTAMDRGVLGELARQGEAALKANGCKPLPQRTRARTPTPILGDRG